MSWNKVKSVNGEQLSAVSGRDEMAMAGGVGNWGEVEGGWHKAPWPVAGKWEKRGGEGEQKDAQVSVKRSHGWIRTFSI